MEEQVRMLERRLEEQSNSMQAMMQMLKEMKDNQEGSQGGRGQRGNHEGRLQGMTPKLQIPSFDGTNPRIWIKKCSRYFSLCNIADDCRVDLASLYMTDKAETWVSSYLAVRKHVDWDDFILDLTARFKDGKGMNVVEHFNKLSQVDSLETYIDEFEELRAILIQNGHTLSEEYVLHSFIGGLKPTIKPFVRAFDPASISQAVKYARLQEEQQQASSYKPYHKTTTQIQTPQTQTFNSNANKPPLLPTPITKSIQPYQALPRTNSKSNPYIPADVRAEKIAKGLCYYCDEKYTRNHKCKFKETQLFTVEIEGCTDSDNEDSAEDKFNEEPCISVHALTGNQSFHTMRLIGVVNRDQPLHILVDSGSTHNFLDLDLAKKLGCCIETMEAQAVAVADGNHLACNHKCKYFTWEMNKHTFSTEVMLIPLGSCDMVLGVQWLCTLGQIVWDFKQLLMQFSLDGMNFTLKGIPPKKLRVLEGDISAKMIDNAAQLCLMQLMGVTVTEQRTAEVLENTLSIDSNFQVLKHKFSKIFEDPTELPPHRGPFDHRIPLKHGAEPVNIRPYRYPLKQRDVIEQLVQEISYSLTFTALLFID
ncbi:uncharacterized protein LOC125493205 [Beta vulgaris subsp. vulgaris]|uniref:uncharacterized protein LOC125493205 n=1 Tax=Beta vulgaris subsp. vulgaris TaxID=3555 RepID=UPI002036A01C|nr:uncharacterized protein LOC125493205 [Beta vulgaris subsp. vulgaris]